MGKGRSPNYRVEYLPGDVETPTLFACYRGQGRPQAHNVSRKDRPWGRAAAGLGLGKKKRSISIVGSIQMSRGV